MKRFNLILYIVILFCGLNSLTIAQVTIIIPDTSALSDSTISIPVIVDDVTAKNILSVGITLTYNPDILAAENAITLNTIAETWGNPTFNTTNGQAIIGMAGTSPLSGAGVLVFINFTVMGQAGDTTTIHFNNVLLNEGEPAAIHKDGLFQVVQNIVVPKDTVKIYIPDTTGEPNTTIDIPILIEDVANMQIMSIGMTLNFDEQILFFESIISKGSLTKLWESLTYNLKNAGELKISYAGTTPVTENGILFFLRFQVRGSTGATCEMQLKNVLLNEGDPVVKTENGLFTIIETQVLMNPINITPNNFELAQNFPNPFNPTTEIKYAIPQATFVEINIYNMLGQKLKSFISEFQAAGQYSVCWDATDFSAKNVSSGIYYYELKTKNFRQIRKMTLLR